MVFAYSILLWLIIASCSLLWLAAIILGRRFWNWLGLFSESHYPTAPWGLIDVMGFLMLQLVCNVVALKIPVSESTPQLALVSADRPIIAEQSSSETSHRVLQTLDAYPRESRTTVTSQTHQRVSAITVATCFQHVVGFNSTSISGKQSQEPQTSTSTTSTTSPQGPPPPSETAELPEEVDSTPTLATNPQTILYVAISNLVCVVLFLVWLKLRYQIALFEVGIWPRTLLADFKLAFVVSLLTLPPIIALHSLLSSLVTYTHHTKDQMEAVPSAFVLAVSFFSAGFVAPIVEEFFYRLILQGWFSRLGAIAGGRLELAMLGDRDAIQQKRYFASGLKKEIDSEDEPLENDEPLDDDDPVDEAESSDETDASHEATSIDVTLHSTPMPISADWLRFLSVAAVVGSAAFFSMMHLGQGLAFIPIFMLGIVLGVVRESTQRILPCVLIHFILNFWSLALIALQPLIESGS